jgi:hypothetical protein
MGTAMHYGINAKSPMRAFQKSGLRFLIGKIRPPHERAVGKHPEIHARTSRKKEGNDVVISASLEYSIFA